RNVKPENSPYRALLNSLEVTEKNYYSCLRQVHLLLEVYGLQGNMTRIKINELHPLKPRYEVPDVLIQDPPTVFTVTGRDEGSVELGFTNSLYKLIITSKPFRMDITTGNELLLSVNPRGLLHFEQLQTGAGKLASQAALALSGRAVCGFSWSDSSSYPNAHSGLSPPSLGSYQPAPNTL
uniref:Neutral alpha-glucosidase AB-like n=1 Tax=Callorhinchus milii TaxID=7868 RepID=A0A4W3GYJ4_CALMI